MPLSVLVGTCAAIENTANAEKAATIHTLSNVIRLMRSPILNGIENLRGNDECRPGVRRPRHGTAQTHQPDSPWLGACHRKFRFRGGRSELRCNSMSAM